MAQNKLCRTKELYWQLIISSKKQTSKAHKYNIESNRLNIAQKHVHAKQCKYISVGRSY